ncbi:MAG: mannose-1-phosphate guanylyltransferase [Planctomycetota bacterium]|nr:mannose-1-phosphate guanylyltransferase [Planctomycetota bacterium]
MRYAIVMAGGAGKRLWPLSRLSRPKQLLPLIGGKNLLEMALERLSGLFDLENILIITNTEYVDKIAKALPKLPVENIIGEPAGRDTANAITLAAALLAGRDEQATMAVFTADHIIRPVESFAQAVNTACDAAEQNPDALLTFGIRPTWPHTGLGYVHCGEKLTDDVYNVLGFQEKPDHQAARRYVESGQYFWNGGMFVWKLSAIRSALDEFLSDSIRKLWPVTGAVQNGREYTQLLAEAYPDLEKISIDYAVMEKARKVLMVELKCEWLDVGSWPALENVTELDGSGNVVVGDNVVVLDSLRNVIVTGDDHLLAVLGLDDCIIAHSDDATLICDKSDSQRLKELVDILEQKYGKKYL